MVPAALFVPLLLAVSAAVQHYQQAVDLIRKGDAGGAARECRAAIGLDPSYAEAHGLLAHILLEQNDPSNAASEFRRAIAARPTADLHFELGLAEGQLGNLAEAAAEFRRAVRLNPKFAHAYDRLGVALRRSDDRTGAMAAFRQAVQADPQDPDARYDLGLELKNSGNLVDAEAEFRKALDIRPDFEKARYNLGLTLRAQGQTASAKKEIDEVKALHDFRTRLAQSKQLILQGVEALKQEQFSKAGDLFRPPPRRAPRIRSASTIWASPSAARRKPIALWPRTSEHWRSSPIMPRPTPAWVRSIGWRTTASGRWRSSAKRSCAIRIWPKRITTTVWR